MEAYMVSINGYLTELTILRFLVLFKEAAKESLVSLVNQILVWIISKCSCLL